MEMERRDLFKGLVGRFKKQRQADDSIHDASQSAPIENGSSSVDESESLPTENSGGSTKMALLTLGGAALLASSPAHAGWMDSLASKLTDGIKKAITPVFEQFTNVLQGQFGDLYNQPSQKVSMVIGGATDTITKVMTETKNADIKAASKPAPDSCRSDAIGQAAATAVANTEQRKVENSVIVTNKVISATPHSVGNSLNKMIKKYGSEGLPTQVSAITGTSNITSDDDIEKAHDFTSLLIGPTAYQGSQALIESSFKNGDDKLALEAQASTMAKTLRLQVAMQPQCNGIAMRDGRVTDSKFALMESEILRTYGDSGEGWRKEIQDYTNPTPLSVELCRLMAFQNYMLFEMLKSDETTQMVAATQLLETMDQNKDANLRHEAA